MHLKKTIQKGIHIEGLNEVDGSGMKRKEKDEDGLIGNMVSSVGGCARRQTVALSSCL